MAQSTRIIDLTGQRFGLLAVQGYVAGSGGRSRHAEWRCTCDCGGQRVVRSSMLRSGRVDHCGCATRRRDSRPRPLLDGEQVCVRPTPSYPAGRTGTSPGYQAHARYGQEPCAPCRQAHASKCAKYYRDEDDDAHDRRQGSNKVASARYRTVRPEQAKAAKARKIAKQRQIIRDAKAAPCADCFVSYPYYVMQFDHLRDKHFNIGSSIAQVSASRLCEEIAKCDVVCANCHAERTHQRRINALRSASEPIPAQAVRLRADAVESGAA